MMNTSDKAAIVARLELRQARIARRKAQIKLDRLRDAIEQIVCDMDDMTRRETRARLIAAHDEAGPIPRPWDLF